MTTRKNVIHPAPAPIGVKSLFVLLFILLFANPSHALHLQGVIRDLTSAEGVIVSPRTERSEWLVAFEPEAVVFPGDILTLLGDPTSIIHPSTGSDLKPIRPAEGRLRVTQVTAGRVYAEKIDGAEPSRGDLVQRYSRLKVLFQDFTGQGESLFVKLRSALPDLEWLPYGLSQKDEPGRPSADIHFLHYSDRVEVRGPARELIRIYEEPADLSKEGQEDFTSLPREKVAEVPVKALFSDFTKVGDKLLLAASDGDGIWIYKVRPNFGLVCRADLRLPTQIISLQWWQPDKEAAPYLAVTGAREQNRGYDTTCAKDIVGIVFRLEGEELISVAEKPSLLLGAFDRDNDARPETLLGQGFTRSQFFGRKTLKLSISENTLGQESFEKALPPNFSVLSATLTNGGKGSPTSSYIRRGKLWIAHEDEVLHRSDVDEGGLATYTYTRNPGAIDALFDTVDLAVPPVFSDMDGDGDIEILAVSTESSSWNPAGMGSSQLIILQVENGEFHREPIGQIYKGAIQGLAVLNGDIWITLTTAEKSIIFSITSAGAEWKM